ncbi:MAG: biotin/lipoyl-containing protein [Pseudomonadota bacterium]
MCPRADRIFFMEMNTRLQVEHPVTEEITGVDLVEWQLRVAAGEPIPLKQEELSIDGHAIEARLYAEDPAKGFLPSTGRLEHLHILPVFARVDTGVEQEAEISPFYDPMIAKVICHGEDRTEAIKALRRSTANTQIYPIKHNAWFLLRLLHLEEFVSGEMTTGSIGDHLDALTEAPKAPISILSMMADDLLYADAFGDDVAKLEGIGGFRLNASRKETMTVLVDGEAIEVTPDSADPDAFVLHLDHSGWSGQLLFKNGATFKMEPYRYDGGSHASAADGAILAPMPGKVIAVDVSEGDAVTAGQRLMVLEAMKMEHALTAPFDGTVTGLEASEGGQVQVEAVLCVVEPSE